MSNGATVSLRLTHSWCSNLSITRMYVSYLNIFASNPLQCLHFDKMTAYATIVPTLTVSDIQCVTWFIRTNILYANVHSTLYIRWWGHQSNSAFAMTYTWHQATYISLRSLESVAINHAALEDVQMTTCPAHNTCADTYINAYILLVYKTDGAYSLMIPAHLNFQYTNRLPCSPTYPRPVN